MQQRPLVIVTQAAGDDQHRRRSASTALLDGGSELLLRCSELRDAAHRLVRCELRAAQLRVERRERRGDVHRTRMTCKLRRKQHSTRRVETLCWQSLLRGRPPPAPDMLSPDAMMNHTHCCSRGDDFLFKTRNWAAKRADDCTADCAATPGCAYISWSKNFQVCAYCRSCEARTREASYASWRLVADTRVPALSPPDLSASSPPLLLVVQSPGKPAVLRPVPSLRSVPPPKWVQAPLNLAPARSHSVSFMQKVRIVPSSTTLLRPHSLQCPPSLRRCTRLARGCARTARCRTRGCSSSLTATSRGAACRSRLDPPPLRLADHRSALASTASRPCCSVSRRLRRLRAAFRGTREARGRTAPFLCGAGLRRQDRQLLGGAAAPGARGARPRAPGAPLARAARRDEAWDAGASARGGYEAGTSHT